MLALVYSILFFFSALPAFTGAAVLPRDSGNGGTSQCNTGDIQCCNGVGTAQALGISGLSGLLDVVVNPVTAILGIDCSPIGVLGGNSCSAQPVCCSNNQFNGLVNIGCTPINLNV